MSDNSQPVKKNRESSIRWQGRTIEQFGYALNLVLGLSVAALGFELSLILDHKVNVEECQKYLFYISMFSLFLSIAVGLWCVVNRLIDFRDTAEIARNRENGATDFELQPMRTLACIRGRRTWLLFKWQMATFGSGILLLVVGIGSAFTK